MTNWDLRFLELAKHIAMWSKDPSTKVGAVIVRPDRTLVSTGFNGFAQRMSDAYEFYRDRDEKYSRIVHAEVNAVLFARASVAGCTLYTWPLAPCDRCAVQMIQAGLTRFVYPKATIEMLTRWEGSLKRTVQYFDEAEVSHLEIDLR